MPCACGLPPWARLDRSAAWTLGLNPRKTSSRAIATLRFSFYFLFSPFAALAPSSSSSTSTTPA
eukprot:746142-Lingulodinium_polyedra.AAC.1